MERGKDKFLLKTTTHKERGNLKLSQKSDTKLQTLKNTLLCSFA